MSKHPSSVAAILKPRFRDYVTPFSSRPRFRTRARNPVGPRPVYRPRLITPMHPHLTSTQLTLQVWIFWRLNLSKTTLSKSRRFSLLCDMLWFRCHTIFKAKSANLDIYKVSEVSDSPGVGAVASGRCPWSQVSAFQHYRNLPLNSPILMSRRHEGVILDLNQWAMLWQLGITTSRLTSHSELMVKMAAPGNKKISATHVWCTKYRTAEACSSVVPVSPQGRRIEGLWAFDN